MFLTQTMKNNPALLETAFALHRSGTIQPDTYLIDVDTLLLNAAEILREAERHGIRLYFMLKQLGRNPWLAKKLTEIGYCGAVCVDFREAQVMMEAQIPIGNVGHLVQIPDALIERLIAYRPEVITVYSYEKIKRLNEACLRQGVIQDILIRVYGPEDDIYSGQTAGFLLEELPALTDRIQAECAGINIKGVTSFPCFLYDEELADFRPTNNLFTVRTATEILTEKGISVDIVNTPSGTCIHTMKMIQENGGNCGEPGHGLTGTTPMHAADMRKGESAHDADARERKSAHDADARMGESAHTADAQKGEPASQDFTELPAAVYVSEISHNFMGQSYCYGGGHYRRSHVEHALVGTDLQSAARLTVIPPAPEAIDYHLGISRECAIGDTVLMAFRFQMFVCRSDVALLTGLRTGNPRIAGIYDCAGRIKT